MIIVQVHMHAKYSIGLISNTARRVKNQFINKI